MPESARSTPPPEVFMDHVQDMAESRLDHLGHRGPTDTRTLNYVDRRLNRMTQETFEIVGVGTLARNQVYEWICDETSESGISLPKLLDSHEGAPGLRTVMAWMRVHPEFRLQYEDAKRARALREAEGAVDEALQAEDKNNANACKVRFEAKKWMAAKLDPANFADKTIQETKHEVTLMSSDDLKRELVASLASNPDILKASKDELAKAGLIIDAEIIQPEDSPPT